MFFYLKFVSRRKTSRPTAAAKKNLVSVTRVLLGSGCVACMRNGEEKNGFGYSVAKGFFYSVPALIVKKVVAQMRIVGMNRNFLNKKTIRLWNIFKLLGFEPCISQHNFCYHLFVYEILVKRCIKGQFNE